uniref:Uncharacterized protein n=1 Tax=Anguilla anguilla TaxID=7936 RepID=A0A0E9VQA0_ANGAN
MGILAYFHIIVWFQQMFSQFPDVLQYACGQNTQQLESLCPLHL